MKVKLFPMVLDGMKDNNTNNDGNFNDFATAQDAIECYGTPEVLGECGLIEFQATLDALTRIIESNGDDMKGAIETWNLEVWGQSFVDESGPVPFTG